MLQLGGCFQQIEQFKLAMCNYEAAVAEITDREANSKFALYYAGRLAMGMKDLEKAENYLTELAGRNSATKTWPNAWTKSAACATRNREMGMSEGIRDVELGIGH